jgi:hypothetical protein
MAKIYVPCIGCLLGAALIIWVFILHKTHEDIEAMRINMLMPSYPLRPAENARLVVSMSTFSRRVQASSLKTIESIIASGPYERLIVSIPLAHRFGIAPEVDPTVEEVLTFYGQALGEFEASGTGYHNANHSVLVQFLREDFGPATKLLGALLVERDPNTIILTVDDDIVYSPLLLPFIRGSAPSEAAFAAVCQTLTPARDNYVWMHDGAFGADWLWRVEPKECQGWLVGWAAVAYRVGFFSEDVFALARNVSHGCFLNDDVWLSGYLMSKGVRRVVFPALPGGMHFRHPTLSLSVIPDAQSGLMTKCAIDMGFQ